MPLFFIEVTGDDRISFDIKIQNNQPTAIRIKRQLYQRTDRVITDIKGFEPFNVGNWMTIVKYDNWKGQAFKDAFKPTPATFSSPLGMHLKVDWGFLDIYLLLDKVFDDLKDNWAKDYHNYGTLPPLPPSRIDHFVRNLPFVSEIAKYIIHDLSILQQLGQEQAIMPLPKVGLDDWLIEVNTECMNRTDKIALRGRLSIEQLGTHQIITHRARSEGENILDTPTI